MLFFLLEALRGQEDNLDKAPRLDDVTMLAVQRAI